MIATKTLEFKTRGKSDMLDITKEIENFIGSCKISSGIVNVFAVGSTGAITTIEYEPGLKKDLPDCLEKIAPFETNYAHHETWGDYNGHSHVKASLIGPSITVPFSDKKLQLGTWQQIVFIDFDNHPRKRSVILKVLGE